VEYEVVAGRQRTKAAREANKRLVDEGKEPLRVRTIIERGEESDMFGVMILENELRQDNTPLAKAKLAQRLLDMGKSEDWVAMTFGVHKQTLRNYLSLLDLCSPVKNAVERGELSASAAAKLSKLHHDEQKQRLETMRSQGGPMTR
jgi:ParB family chromosome partitioning protein